MSRLGKKLIEIPQGVKVALSGRTVNVEGPEGKTSWSFRPEVGVKIEENKRIVVSRSGETKVIRSLHGTTRSIIASMVQGASKGFQKDLEISGVGYNAKLAGDKLTLTLGYSHPVELKIPAGLKVTVPAPTQISVRGADKRLVGEFAALIRRSRKVEPYNLKGIKYKDEAVRRKAGKTFVTGAS
jgi:large subunit ribosomal protein L6